MENETVSSIGVAPPPPAAKPPVMSSSPIDRVVGDLAVEWKGRGRYPPGPGGNTFTRTLRMARDPLPILLGGYEEYGPIFTLRLLHTKVVFMLGPEANHHMLVSHAENFRWRSVVGKVETTLRTIAGGHPQTNAHRPNPMRVQ